MPGFDITAWFAVVGPQNMPKDVVAKLSGASAVALKHADVKDKLAGIGMQPMFMAPDALKSFMTTEVAKWIRLARDANIQPE
jgi:tripartite-type tricarboxylate transporter receptor subunit TctC